MLSLARRIDAVNDWIGRATAWMALTMVAVQFAVVIMRYVFGVGSIVMQESVVYMHAVLFLIGAGYTLLHNGHVRVDVLYREATPRAKAIVDLAGVAVFLWPMCAVIAWYAWPYVTSSWAVFEGSRETSGIRGVFLLKTTILAFAGLLALQGLSLAIRAALALAGHRPPQPAAAADEPPAV